MFVLDKHCYDCEDWYWELRSVNPEQSVEGPALRTRQLPTCMDQTAVSGLGCILAVQECDEMRRCGFGGGKLFIGFFSWISDQPLTSF